MWKGSCNGRTVTCLGPSYNPAMKVREAIRLIEEDGWYLVTTRGSHRQYKHPRKSGACHSRGQAVR